MIVIQVFTLLWTLSHGFNFGAQLPHRPVLIIEMVTGFFNGKLSISNNNNALAKKEWSRGRFSTPFKHLATTLDDVEVERLASSARKRKIVDSFVEKMGGKRSIQKILIANNG